METFKKTKTLFAFILLVVTCVGTNGYAVQKKELMKSTQLQAVSAIERIASNNKDFLNANSADKKAFNERISQRVAIFIDSINQIPEDDISEDVANWVKQSLVAEIKGLGASFLFGTDYSAIAYKSYKNRAIDRFSNLTNAKGEELLRRRNNLQDGLKTIKSDLRRFIYGKFSEFDVVKMEVNDPIMLSFYEAIELSIESDHEIEESILDLRSDKVYSEIITRALLKKSLNTISKSESVFQLGFFSILSPIFKDELPKGFKPYESKSGVLVKWDKIFNSFVERSDGAVIFDAGLIDQFMWDALDVAYGAEKEYSSPKDALKKYVFFINDKESWSHLLDGEY